MNKTVSIQLQLLMLLVIVPLVGCQSINLKPQRGKLLQNIKPEKRLSINETPNRVLIIWKDAVVRSSNGQTKKGFGGRIYFYGQGEDPIKVDGQLVVYGYDDTEDNESSAPERKYVFEREKFDTHYDPTELGHAYSVWVAWEDVGGFEKTISLMPFFEPVEGKRISAGLSEVTLPGKRPKVETVEKTTAPARPMPTRVARYTPPASSSSSNSGVVHASAVEADSPGNVQFASGPLQPDEATRSRTHTIELPDSLKERIQNAPPQKSFGKKRTNVEANYRNAMNKIVEQRFEALEKQQQAAASVPKKEVLPAGSFKKQEPNHPVFGQPAPFKRSR